MYALAFDMVISDLQKYYGEPYNKAYYEIKELLKKNGFEWVQGSTYMTMNDDLTALVKTVMELSKIEWFKKSVRDLRGFKVERAHPINQGENSLILYKICTFAP